MTSRDALNLYLETRHTTANVIHGFVVDTAENSNTGVTGRQDAIDFAQSVLHLDPIFRQRLYRYPGNLHYPYWVEDASVDVASRVRVVRQTPGDVDVVRRLIADFTGEMFDLDDGPAWRMYFVVDVHGVEGVPNGGTVMVVKFHHSAIDGVGASDLMSRVLSPTTPMPRPTPDEEAIPSTMRALATVPLDLLRLASAAVRRAADDRRQREEPAPVTRSVPATRFNGDKEPEITWDVTWFDLRRIRRVKSAHPSATVNDLATTMISLALSTYLEERGELPEQSLSISVPMSTRSITDADTANQVTPMSIDLHTTIADPHDRLDAVHRSLAESKSAVQTTLRRRRPPHPLTVLPSALVPIIGVLSPAPAKNPVTAPTSTMLSNVSYGSGRLALRGAPVVGCFGALPTVRGVHLTHSVRSVGTSFSIAVTSNRRVMPDMERYLAALQDALDRLDPDR